MKMFMFKVFEVKQDSLFLGFCPIGMNSEIAQSCKSESKRETAPL